MTSNNAPGYVNSLLEFSRPEHKLVFLLEDNADLAEELSSRMAHFGYKAALFKSIHEVQEALKQQVPIAIILDLDITFISAKETPQIGAREISKMAGEGTPLFVISERDDLRSRLDAVRLGAVAYFPKPLDLAGLMAKLASFEPGRSKEPYRILIVDDDESAGKYHAACLEKVGVHSRLVTDSLKVFPVLTDFKPDLILMDLYMPGCSGLELAAIIRQYEGFLSIPIVFVSGEADPARQKAIISLGNDDFLTKPVKIEQLVRSVTMRAQRYRVLQSFMVRDSLTSLINRTVLTEQLDIEIARARRRTLPLVFALIKIDRLKAINETYGFHVGDQVIKGLSKLLQERLRRTDILGKYHGDTFGVILIDADLLDAKQTLEKIRTQFKRAHYRLKKVTFSATFSYSLSSFPLYSKTNALLAAAEKGLSECSLQEGKDFANQEFTKQVFLRRL